MTTRVGNQRNYDERERASWQEHPENVVASVLRDELGLDEKGHLAYPVTLAARIVGALKREKWLRDHA